MEILEEDGKRTDATEEPTPDGCMEEDGDYYEDGVDAEELKAWYKEFQPWMYATIYWEEIEPNEQEAILLSVTQTSYGYRMKHSKWFKFYEWSWALWIGAFGISLAHYGFGWTAFLSLMVGLLLPIMTYIKKFKISVHEKWLDINWMLWIRKVKFSEIEHIEKEMDSYRIVVRWNAVRKFFKSIDFSLELINDGEKLTWYIAKFAKTEGVEANKDIEKRDGYFTSLAKYAFYVNLWSVVVATVAAFMKYSATISFAWIALSFVAWLSTVTIAVLWKGWFAEGIALLMDDHAEPPALWRSILTSIFWLFPLTIFMPYETRSWFPPESLMAIWWTFLLIFAIVSAFSWRKTGIISVILGVLYWFSGAFWTLSHFLYFNKALDQSVPIVWFSAEIRKTYGCNDCWKYEIRHEKIPWLEANHLADTNQLSWGLPWDVVLIPMKEWFLWAEWYDVDSSILLK